ncbi:MAG: molybdenum cofactor guanylyltransferase [Deltaproteobacteria bacterium]|nr:MAG: molybdenum cofactor guanylyltransferase [Deltaproteobacteria bacterium]
MTYPCTGVILAGGLNSRFNGKDKALIHVGRKKVLDRLSDIFCDLFDEKILVTNDPIKYIAWDFKLATDIFPIRSSLTGIHTSLFFTTNPYVFVTACDTPYLKKEIVEFLIGNIEARLDVIIPETEAGLEPLCAVYSTKCLKPAEHNLRQQKLKIQQFFNKVRVKKIPEKDLRSKDPDLISFFNINTPADLHLAESIEAGALEDNQTSP